MNSSRTVSAFAAYHATTRGTASQTVKSLVKRGYLRRTRSRRDGRSGRLDPSAKAKTVLKNDPLEALTRATNGLAPGTRRGLAESLGRILERLADERRGPAFGVCGSCRHLAHEARGAAGQPTYRCRLFDETLDGDELVGICVNYQARVGAAPAAPAKEAAR